jgi:Zn-dependent metalloprotease
MMRSTTRHPYKPLFVLLSLHAFLDAGISRGQVPDRDEEALIVVRARDSQRATFVTARDGGPIVAPDAGGVAAALVTPEQFLDRFGRLFGVANRTTELRAAGTEQDLLGRRQTRFKQVFRGLPVFGGQIRVHQDDWGRVLAANGDFFEIPAKLNVRPHLSADQAVRNAMAEFEVVKPVALRSELLVVDPGWYGDPPTGARLSYLVELEDSESFFAEAFFVDAQTGKILDRWMLVEQVRNRQIFDGQNTRDLPGILARSENGPAVVTPIDVNRAYHYYGDTYDYFSRAFGRDSMDDRGIPMVATVNTLAPGCPNAFWSSSRRQMAFCLGTVTDDITAHEMTHGITYFTAELIYQNQSGQLNESFSDVFGELVDLFNGNAAFPLETGAVAWPAHAIGPGLDQLNSLRTECSPATSYHDGVRWLMGEDAWAFGGAIRDMWDPTCRFNPDRAWSPLNTCGPGNNGGVHSGSGIPNHAFAMVTDGKDFNGYSVSGIGAIKSGAVWYRALTTYLNPTSDFEDAFHAFRQSALDLIGAFPNDPRTGFPSNRMFTRSDAEQVEKALRAVEMNGPGRCGQTVPIVSAEPDPRCGHEAVIFSDDFEIGAPGWTVENTATLDPYDWALTADSVPHGRGGTVFHCPNTTIGNCLDKDESGLHSLISPPIALPQNGMFPHVRFSHFVDVETGYDGGSLSVRTNGGRWVRVPGSSFNYNPYNTRLRTAQAGNTSPLAGDEVWSGIGGEWGTSVVDLRGLARGGDTIELRFDFGKDGCTGRQGWYLDDVEVFTCGDCNFNGHPDHVDLIFRHTSGSLGPIGVGSPQRFRIHSPPIPAGDVALSAYAVADLTGELQDESLFLWINGEFLAEIFTAGARDCPITPDRIELTIPREQFRRAAATGAVTIDIAATDAVNPTLCGGTSWVRIDFAYETTSRDLNGNRVPDECEGCFAHALPHPAEGLAAANRHLEFVPASASGRHLAYRIRRTADGLAASIALTPMWVGPARLDAGGAAVSRLRCTPFFSAEWDFLKPILVKGDLVVPGATYQLDAIDLGCWPLARVSLDAAMRPFPWNYYSDPLALRTSVRWGDVTGDPGGGPDGVVDLLDISAVVDRFIHAPGAVALHRADLTPAIPDGVVDFTDVAAVVSAFRGQPYPYASTEHTACIQRVR